jgi:hypothetical protein
MTAEQLYQRDLIALKEKQLREQQLLREKHPQGSALLRLQKQHLMEREAGERELLRRYERMVQGAGPSDEKYSVGDAFYAINREDQSLSGLSSVSGISNLGLGLGSGESNNESLNNFASLGRADAFADGSLSLGFGLGLGSDAWAPLGTNPTDKGMRQVEGGLTLETLNIEAKTSSSEDSVTFLTGLGFSDSPNKSVITPRTSNFLRKTAIGNALSSNVSGSSFDTLSARSGSLSPGDAAPPPGFTRKISKESNLFKMGQMAADKPPGLAALGSNDSGATQRDGLSEENSTMSQPPSIDLSQLVTSLETGQSARGGGLSTPPDSPKSLRNKKKLPLDCPQVVRRSSLGSMDAASQDPFDESMFDFLGSGLASPLMRSRMNTMESPRAPSRSTSNASLQGAAPMSNLMRSASIDSTKNLVAK